MQDDPQLAIAALVELPSPVHRHHLAILVGDHDVPHRGGDVVDDEDGSIFDVALTPSLEDKSLVTRIISVPANEVGKASWRLVRKVWGTTVKVGLNNTGPNS
ncbi:hypothetical protein KBY66_12140 [Synechococcus sp. Tobar12-5m-g]|uniref:hypothetical protein n=1 Tax=unclassified Synechococcus TaxID=2626047 RepID=UPI0020CBFB56|nr:MULTISPECIES: hypothetical protein [unclassified Synechococcus]MCP9773362.1 hypothetical protein [Synechococcus sp. Tobar12-5m-g]MCP9874151.1 hypothetical protein [Synechococcus sp. Cruz CV-v-12]